MVIAPQRGGNGRVFDLQGALDLQLAGLDAIDIQFQVQVVLAMQRGECYGRTCPRPACRILQKGPNAVQCTTLTGVRITSSSSVLIST